MALRRLQQLQQQTELSSPLSSTASSVQEFDDPFGQVQQLRQDPELEQLLVQLQGMADDPRRAQFSAEEEAEFQGALQQADIIQQVIGFDPQQQQQQQPLLLAEGAFEQEQQLQEPFGVPQQRVRGQLAPLLLQPADDLDLLFGVPQGRIGGIEDIIGDFVVHQDAFVPEFTEFNADLRRLEQEFLNVQQSQINADAKRLALNRILGNIQDVQQLQFIQTEEILEQQERALDLTVVPPEEEEFEEEPPAQLFEEEAPEEEPEAESFELQQLRIQIAEIDEQLAGDLDRQVRRQLVRQVDQLNDQVDALVLAEQAEEKEEPPEVQAQAGDDPNVALRERLIAQIRAIEQRAINMAEKQRQIGPLIRRIETLDENLIADARIDHPFAIEDRLSAPQVFPAVPHVGLGERELDQDLANSLGDISDRIGQEQLTIQGIDRFTNANQIANFRTDGFNEDIIANTIQRNLDEAGETIADRFQLKRELQQVFEVGIKGALASNNPSVNLLGVISEIGRAVNRLPTEGEEEIERIQEITDQALFALVGPKFLESFSFAPLRLPRILGQAFSPDMDRLMEENLPIAEIQEIARVFASELPDVLVRGFGEEVDTTNHLRQIRNYINDTVANQLLRDTIISDIDVRIATNTRESQEQLQTDPFLILPQSIQRSIRIRQNQKKDIGDLIQEKINLLDTDLEPFEEIESNTEEINAFLRNFNQYSAEHNIRVPLSVDIPGEQEEEKEEGAVDKEFIIPLIRDADDLNAVQIRQILVDVRNMFSTGNVEFTFNPTMAEGPDGQLTDTLIKDLRQMLMVQASASARDLRTVGDTKIGNITVGRLSDNRRVITIPPNTTINNIMVLAYTLKKESGTLGDATGVLSIFITPKTDVRTIVSLIMNVMKRNSGKEFMLIYVPMSPVGGMFLDSSLKNIRAGKQYKGGLLLQPTGIGKPDMLQKIANKNLIMFTRFV